MANLKQRADLIHLARQIGDELIEQPCASTGITSVNLASGLAGRAVFFTHLGMADRAHSHFLEIAEQTLHTAVDTLSRTEFVIPGLFTGLTGISWAVHHVSSLLNLKEFQRDETYDDVLDFLDGFLQWDKQYEYDLINGLVGIGAWALALSESKRRTALLERICVLLQRSAEITPQGLCWRTRATQRQGLGRPNQDPEEFNLGVAHGVPGVIGFLSLCIKHGHSSDFTHGMLVDAVRFLENRTLGDNEIALFPYASNLMRPTRLGWCYGDAGISLVLFMAADALHSREIRLFATKVSQKWLNRRLDELSFINDASVCHGTAGLAHLSWKLRRYCKSSELELSHQFWFDLLLHERRFEHGICGFPCFDGVKNSYSHEGGMLIGASGVGLVLLTHATGDCGWDYPFLMG